MLYKSGNILVKSGTTYFKQVVKQITFQVEGDRFPIRTAGAFGSCYFLLSQNVDVTVNYGDGVVNTYSTVGSNPKFGYKTDSVDDSNVGELAPHIFQDGETGLRNITFEFSNLSALTDIYFNYCQLSGNFPAEVVFANNLRQIYLQITRRLNSILNEVINIPSLEIYSVGRAFLVTPTFIPSELFNSNLKQLNVSGTILTNNTSSNFFLINQLSDTLTFFQATGSQIEELPNELFECTLLYYLGLDNNNFQKIDERLNLLTNLKILHFGYVDVTVDNSLPDWNNLTKLEVVFLASPDSSHNGFNYSDIVTNWVGLKNLSSFLLFQRFCRTDAQLNAFIPSWYQLITENGFLDPSSQAAIDSGYPNQFRSISWGHSSLTVDSPIVAPSGFVQGVSNGTPTTNGERVYVLMANYSHVTPY